MYTVTIEKIEPEKILPGDTATIHCHLQGLDAGTLNVTLKSSPFAESVGVTKLHGHQDHGAVKYLCPIDGSAEPGEYAVDFECTVPRSGGGDGSVVQTGSAAGPKLKIGQVPPALSFAADQPGLEPSPDDSGAFRLGRFDIACKLSEPSAERNARATLTVSGQEYAVAFDAGTTAAVAVSLVTPGTHRLELKAVSGCEAHEDDAKMVLEVAVKAPVVRFSETAIDDTYKVPGAEDIYKIGRARVGCSFSYWPAVDGGATAKLSGQGLIEPSEISLPAASGEQRDVTVDVVFLDTGGAPKSLSLVADKNCTVDGGSISVKTQAPVVKFDDPAIDAGMKIPGSTDLYKIGATEIACTFSYHPDMDGAVKARLESDAIEAPAEFVLGGGTEQTEAAVPVTLKHTGDSGKKLTLKAVENCSVEAGADEIELTVRWPTLSFADDTPVKKVSFTNGVVEKAVLNIAYDYLPEGDGPKIKIACPHIKPGAVFQMRKATSSDNPYPLLVDTPDWKTAQTWDAPATLTLTADDTPSCTLGANTECTIGNFLLKVERIASFYDAEYRGDDEKPFFFGDKLKLTLSLNQMVDNDWKSVADLDTLEIKGAEPFTLSGEIQGVKAFTVDGTITDGNAAGSTFDVQLPGQGAVSTPLSEADKRKVVILNRNAKLLVGIASKTGGLCPPGPDYHAGKWTEADKEKRTAVVSPIPRVTFDPEEPIVHGRPKMENTGESDPAKRFYYSILADKQTLRLKIDKPMPQQDLQCRVYSFGRFANRKQPLPTPVVATFKRGETTTTVAAEFGHRDRVSPSIKEIAAYPLHHGAPTQADGEAKLSTDTIQVRYKRSNRILLYFTANWRTPDNRVAAPGDQVWLKLYRDARELAQDTVELRIVSQVPVFKLVGRREVPLFDDNDGVIEVRFPADSKESLHLAKSYAGIDWDLAKDKEQSKGLRVKKDAPLGLYEVRFADFQIDRQSKSSLKKTIERKWNYQIPDKTEEFHLARRIAYFPDKKELESASPGATGMVTVALDCPAAVHTWLKLRSDGTLKVLASDYHVNLRVGESLVKFPVRYADFETEGQTANRVLLEVYNGNAETCPPDCKAELFPFSLTAGGQTVFFDQIHPVEKPFQKTSARDGATGTRAAAAVLHGETIVARLRCSGPIPPGNHPASIKLKSDAIRSGEKTVAFPRDILAVADLPAAEENEKGNIYVKHGETQFQRCVEGTPGQGDWKWENVAVAEGDGILDYSSFTATVRVPIRKKYLNGDWVVRDLHLSTDADNDAEPPTPTVGDVAVWDGKYRLFSGGTWQEDTTVDLEKCAFQEKNASGRHAYMLRSDTWQQMDIITLLALDASRDPSGGRKGDRYVKNPRFGSRVMMVCDGTTWREDATIDIGSGSHLMDVDGSIKLRDGRNWKDIEIKTVIDIGLTNGPEIATVGDLYVEKDTHKVFAFKAGTWEELLAVKAGDRVVGPAGTNAVWERTGSAWKKKPRDVLKMLPTSEIPETLEPKKHQAVVVTPSVGGGRGKQEYYRYDGDGWHREHEVEIGDTVTDLSLRRHENLACTGFEQTGGNWETRWTEVEETFVTQVSLTIEATTVGKNVEKIVLDNAEGGLTTLNDDALFLNVIHDPPVIMLGKKPEQRQDREKEGDGWIVPAQDKFVLGDRALINCHLHPAVYVIDDTNTRLLEVSGIGNRPSNQEGKKGDRWLDDDTLKIHTKTDTAWDGGSHISHAFAGEPYLVRNLSRGLAARYRYTGKQWELDTTATTYEKVVRGIRLTKAPMGPYKDDRYIDKKDRYHRFDGQKWLSEGKVRRAAVVLDLSKLPTEFIVHPNEPVRSKRIEPVIHPPRVLASFIREPNASGDAGTVTVSALESGDKAGAVVEFCGYSSKLKAIGAYFSNLFHHRTFKKTFLHNHFEVLVAGGGAHDCLGMIPGENFNEIHLYDKRHAFLSRDEDIHHKTFLKQTAGQAWTDKGAECDIIVHLDVPAPLGGVQVRLAGKKLDGKTALDFFESIAPAKDVDNGNDPGGDLGDDEKAEYAIYKAGENTLTFRTGTRQGKVRIRFKAENIDDKGAKILLEEITPDNTKLHLAPDTAAALKAASLPDAFIDALAADATLKNPVTKDVLEQKVQTLAGPNGIPVHAVPDFKRLLVDACRPTVGCSIKTRFTPVVYVGFPKIKTLQIDPDYPIQVGGFAVLTVELEYPAPFGCGAKVRGKATADKTVLGNAEVPFTVRRGTKKTAVDIPIEAEAANDVTVEVFDFQKMRAGSTSEVTFTVEEIPKIEVAVAANGSLYQIGDTATATALEKSEAIEVLDFDAATGGSVKFHFRYANAANEGRRNFFVKSSAFGARVYNLEFDTETTEIREDLEVTAICNTHPVYIVDPKNQKIKLTKRDAISIAITPPQPVQQCPSHPSQGALTLTQGPQTLARSRVESPCNLTAFKITIKNRNSEAVPERGVGNKFWISRKRQTVRDGDDANNECNTPLLWSPGRAPVIQVLAGRDVGAAWDIEKRVRTVRSTGGTEIEIDVNQYDENGLANVFCGESFVHRYKEKNDEITTTHPTVVIQERFMDPGILAKIGKGLTGIWWRPGEKMSILQEPSENGMIWQPVDTGGLLKPCPRTERQDFKDEFRKVGNRKTDWFYHTPCPVPIQLRTAEDDKDVKIDPINLTVFRAEQKPGTLFWTAKNLPQQYLIEVQSCGRGDTSRPSSGETSSLAAVIEVYPDDEFCLKIGGAEDGVLYNVGHLGDFFDPEKGFDPDKGFDKDFKKGIRSVKSSPKTQMQPPPNFEASPHDKKKIRVTYTGDDRQFDTTCEMTIKEYRDICREEGLVREQLMEDNLEIEAPEEKSFFDHAEFFRGIGIPKSDTWEALDAPPSKHIKYDLADETNRFFTKMEEVTDPSSGGVEWEFESDDLEIGFDENQVDALEKDGADATGFTSIDSTGHFRGPCDAMQSLEKEAMGTFDPLQWGTFDDNVESMDTILGSPLWGTIPSINLYHNGRPGNLDRIIRLFKGALWLAQFVVGLLGNFDAKWGFGFGFKITPKLFKCELLWYSGWKECTDHRVFAWNAFASSGTLVGLSVEVNFGIGVAAYCLKASAMVFGAIGVELGGEFFFETQDPVTRESLRKTATDNGNKLGDRCKAGAKCAMSSSLETLKVEVPLTAELGLRAVVINEAVLSLSGSVESGIEVHMDILGGFTSEYYHRGLAAKLEINVLFNKKEMQYWIVKPMTKGMPGFSTCLGDPDSMDRVHQKLSFAMVALESRLAKLKGYIKQYQTLQLNMYIAGGKPPRAEEIPGHRPAEPSREWRENKQRWDEQWQIVTDAFDREDRMVHTRQSYRKFLLFGKKESLLIRKSLKDKLHEKTRELDAIVEKFTAAIHRLERGDKVLQKHATEFFELKESGEYVPKARRAELSDMADDFLWSVNDAMNQALGGDIPHLPWHMKVARKFRTQDGKKSLLFKEFQETLMSLHHYALKRRRW